MSKEDLIPFTKETARSNQLKSAKKRHENCLKRDVVKSAIIDIFNGMMSINDETRNGVLKMGTHFGKKEPFGKFAVASLLQKAIKKGDYRAIIELARFAGMSHDQSPEGRGGENNPINYAERVGRPSKEYMEEIRKQAIELGVYSDADSGND